MNMESLVEIKPNPKIPEVAPGDTVRVSTRIVESGKKRIQIFQGVVIRLRRGGAGTSFTVRHVAHGIGVERTFPFYSPSIEKVTIVRHGEVRRAKLYYLRERSGKSARIKERRVGRGKQQIELEEPEQLQEPIPVEEMIQEPVAEQEPTPEDAPAEELAPEQKQEPELAEEPISEEPGEVQEPVAEQEPAPEDAPAEELAPEQKQEPD
ncbi:50S ribosomal protein L19 [Chloroflexota bacterium]